MKKVFIISCFDEYTSRNKYVESYFLEKGYSVVTYMSNFHHQKKHYIGEAPRQNVILVNTPKYKRNMSFRRIYNHFVFAKHILSVVKKEKPDIVYANIPPNFVSYYLGRLRNKAYINKLIFDIYDMWPETMTFGKTSLLLKLPFSLWRSIRNKYINYSDLNITACELHLDILRGQGVHNLKNLFLIKERDITVDSIPKYYDLDVLKICYLGSVNNIIDIEKIVEIITNVSKLKKVQFIFIGGGENKKLLFDSIKETECEIIDYGMIFDEKQKQDVLVNCHFGLNIMKPQVCVGVTLKSLDYFSCGLPIINSIPKDTKELIKRYKAGINIESGIEDVTREICLISSEKLCEMKMNALKMYKDNFSPEYFKEEFVKLIEGVIV